MMVLFHCSNAVVLFGIAYAGEHVRKKSSGIHRAADDIMSRTAEKVYYYVRAADALQQSSSHRFVFVNVLHPDMPSVGAIRYMSFTMVYSVRTLQRQFCGISWRVCTVS